MKYSEIKLVFDWGRGYVERTVVQESVNSVIAHATTTYRTILACPV